LLTTTEDAIGACTAENTKLLEDQEIMDQIVSNKASSEQRLNAFERFTKKSVWPGYAGCIWAVLYAVFVRFYQAAGGSIGIPGQPKDPEALYMVSYIAGLIIMFCGFALIALVKPWGKVVPNWIPFFGGRKIHRLIILIPTLLCTAFLIAHGVGGIVTKALHLTSIITLDNFPGFVELDVHRMVLWDFLVYEPWFFIMGILAGLTAAHYAQASGVPLSTLRRTMVFYLILVFLLTMLFVSSIVFGFVDKISF
jgi:hypothetical protein